MNNQEYLQSFDQWELLGYWNEFCEVKKRLDDKIYFNDAEFLDQFKGDNDCHWLACRLFYGDYSPMHDFVRINGYGNLDTTDFLTDWIDGQDFIDWLNSYVEPE